MTNHLIIHPAFQAPFSFAPSLYHVPPLSFIMHSAVLFIARIHTRIIGQKRRNSPATQIRTEKTGLADFLYRPRDPPLWNVPVGAHG